MSDYSSQPVEKQSNLIMFAVPRMLFFFNNGLRSTNTI